MSIEKTFGICRKTPENYFEFRVTNMIERLRTLYMLHSNIRVQFELKLEKKKLFQDAKTLRTQLLSFNLHVSRVSVGSRYDLDVSDLKRHFLFHFFTAKQLRLQDVQILPKATRKRI